MSVVQRHIFICNAKKPEGIPDCTEKSGQDIMEAFKSAIYNRNKESEILVSGSSCLGICNFGPAAVVYPEGHWYSGIKIDEVEKIVEQHLINGTPVTDREDIDEATIQSEQKAWHERMRAKFAKKGKL